MSIFKPDTEEILRSLADEITGFLNARPSQYEEAEPNLVAESINGLFREFWAREFHNKDKVREFLWRLWNMIISLASQMQPEDERFERLIQLLKDLKKLRPTFSLPWVGMPVVWEDMPLLGYCLCQVAKCQFSPLMHFTVKYGWADKLTSFLHDSYFFCSGYMDLFAVPICPPLQQGNRGAYRPCHLDIACSPGRADFEWFGAPCDVGGGMPIDSACRPSLVHTCPVDRKADGL